MQPIQRVTRRESDIIERIATSLYIENLPYGVRYPAPLGGGLVGYNAMHIHANLSVEQAERRIRLILEKLATLNVKAAPRMDENGYATCLVLFK